MSNPRKTAIVTGASQGIGAGIVKGFVERGFNVVTSGPFARGIGGTERRDEGTRRTIPRSERTIPGTEN